MTYVAPKARVCLCCDLDLDKEQSVGYTMWNTSGGYGSTLYDPIVVASFDEIPEPSYVFAFICDPCFIKKFDLMTPVQVIKSEPVRKRSEWEPLSKAERKELAKQQEEELASADTDPPDPQ